MVRLGILTIYGGSNYGNKLQNYALQFFLKEMGYSVETIRYSISFDKHVKGKLSKIKLLRRKYFSDGFAESVYNLRRIIDKHIHNKEISAKSANRTRAISQFEEKNISLSDKFYNTAESLLPTKGQYDYIIIGSDQVWNPYWQGSRDEFFLSFLEKNQRIAYAPSIGVSSIPDQERDRYKALLSGFNHLSCREKTGAETIRNLTGLECEHVVDPVFLLDSDKWDQVCKTAEKPNHKFILTYFLAGMRRSTMKVIDSFARENGLEIVDAFSHDSCKSKFASVEEFINLIKNAEIVFTDSFHGTAFSIIFKRQFVVCDRRFQAKSERMNSRIDDLLERLGIRNRNIESNWKTNLINYTVISEILAPWIQHSKDYLMKQIR